MDSKAKRVGILLALCVALAVMAAVAFINYRRFVHGASSPSKDDKEQAAVDDGGGIAEDGRVKGADLSAFLYDEDFFDKEVSNGSNLSHASNEETASLTLLASSVQRDIRVKIVDDKGDVVPGHDFMVEVEGEGTYFDEDRDGVVHIMNVKPGDYKVSLGSVEGFEVPSDPANVRVKSIVSYTPIDDISFFVHSEDEIDVLNDDLEYKNEAVDEDDEDDTQYTALLDKDEHDNAVSLGIDVSKWNKEIDWEVVKAEGVDFAIIRCGYRGSSSGLLVEDPYFYKNIEGAKKAGIKVGVYFFSQAVDLVEAVEEASMVIALLNGTELDFPIFIDIEGMGGNGRADGLDADMRTAIVNAFCQTIQNSQMEAGVYSSRNWYYNNLNTDEFYDIKIWLAEYRQTPLYEGRYDMWQYTSSGAVGGIEGRVDLNVSYLNI